MREKSPLIKFRQLSKVAIFSSHGLGTEGQSRAIMEVAEIITPTLSSDMEL